MIAAGGEAGSFAGGAVDIVRSAAAPADEVVVVVTDAVLVEGGGTGGLDAADEPFFAEECERVVDGLLGNGADFRANVIANDFSSAVGMCRDGAHDGQPLGGHGDPVIAEEDGGVWLRGHEMELFYFWNESKLIQGEFLTANLAN